jgi:hypothetical protein
LILDIGDFVLVVVPIRAPIFVLEPVSVFRLAGAAARRTRAW